jgi:hypothetical protein
MGAIAHSLRVDRRQEVTFVCSDQLRHGALLALSPGVSAIGRSSVGALLLDRSCANRAMTITGDCHSDHAVAILVRIVVGGELVRPEARLRRVEFLLFTEDPRASLPKARTHRTSTMIDVKALQCRWVGMVVATARTRGSDEASAAKELEQIIGVVLVGTMVTELDPV